MLDTAHVEVTITPELRQLCAGRHWGGVTNQTTDVRVANRTSDVQVTSAIPPRAGDGTWPVLWLRRDGERPAKIRGLQVWDGEAVVNTPSGAWTVHVALHVTHGRDAYMAFVAQPPPDAQARPIYRCAQLRDGQALTHLADWLHVIGCTAGRAHAPTGANVTHNVSSIPGLRLADVRH